MSQTEQPAFDLKREYADETMHLIRRLIGGSFALSELDGGLPDLGPWTNEVAQIIDAYREGWTLAGGGEEADETARREAAKQSAAAKFRELCKSNHDLMIVMSGGYSEPAYEPPPPPPVPAGLLCPPMDEGVLVDLSLGSSVCREFETFIEWGRQWSPDSYPAFFPAAFIWMLSTVAARRLYTHHGKKRYTPLLIAFVAYSSEQAKSMVVGMARQVLESSGLDYLLIGSDPTPAALYRRFSGHVPENYDELPDEEKERIRWELRFAAQRGWPYDEFGIRLRSMLDDRGGPYTEYSKMFRVADDCQPYWEPETIARGRERVRFPYVSLLASLTPPDIARFAKRGSSVWGDGLFGRIAFIYPSEDEEPTEGDFPLGERIVPSSLIKAFARWHQRLGVPEEPKIEKKETHYAVTLAPLPQNQITLAPDVIDAHNRYYRALKRMVRKIGIPDLKSNYIRLADKCLTAAMLFASFDGQDTVTLPYFAKAQDVMEQWRASLHNMYREMVAPPETPAKDIEGRIFLQISAHGWRTARDLAGPCKLAITDAHKICERLVAAGTLIKGKTMHGTDRYAFPMTPEPERKKRANAGKEKG